LLTILLVLELDERVLETVTGALVTYDLARQYLPESAEDQIQILVYTR
jgi:hypothetical protein